MNIERFTAKYPFSVLYRTTSKSTNDEMKNLAKENAKEGTVVITDHQLEGRGRLGKQFFSPKGCGVYFSLLLRPSFSAEHAVFITVAAAVAVRRAVKKLFGTQTQIKWVNDLYFCGKKFCGILTEAAVSKDSNKLDYAILGIGLNLTTPENGYPEEFAFKTTNISSFVPQYRTDTTDLLVAEILKNFYDLYLNLEEKAYLKEYKDASCVIGKKIEILTGAHTGYAFAEDIDENANLIVRTKDGRCISLSSGDVSIHL